MTLLLPLLGDLGFCLVEGQDQGTTGKTGRPHGQLAKAAIKLLNIPGYKKVKY